MLTPSDIREIENEISRIYSQVETDLVRHVCNYLARNMDNIDPEHWRLRKLKGWGVLQIDLERVVARDTRLLDKQLTACVNRAVEKNNATDEALIEALKKYATSPEGTQQNPNLTLTLNDTQRRRLSAVLMNARHSINLTNTSAIQACEKIMTDACNKAYLSVMEGTETLQNAVYRASKSLARQGVTVATYSSGKRYNMSIDSAVRRNVVTSVSQATSKMTIETAQANGCDLVKTSEHMGARPSHFLWQGKVFSLSGKSDKYPSLADGTGYGTAGGLCGCNCRHYFFPYAEGFNPASYGLEDVTKKENEEVYKAQQKQRQYEREIRAWKRVKSVANDRRNIADVRIARTKIEGYQSKLRALCEEYDLPRQYDREKV